MVRFLLIEKPDLFFARMRLSALVMALKCASMTDLKHSLGVLSHETQKPLFGSAYANSKVWNCHN